MDALVQGSEQEDQDHPVEQHHGPDQEAVPGRKDEAAGQPEQAQMRGEPDQALPVRAYREVAQVSPVGRSRRAPTPAARW